MDALTIPGKFQIERDPGLTAAIAAEWSARSRRPDPVSITDLVDPRPAYFRRISPVEATPEAAARRESGRLAHDQIERLLAPPHEREVRVERDGVVGRMDVLGETPTEVKWTAELPPDDELLPRRATYFDQLGMYCALTGRPHGRLVVVSGTTGGAPRARVYQCEFSALETIWTSMCAQADQLRAAWTSRDPASLPRCGWFDHGCEFQLQHVCACRGTEPAPPEPAHQHLLAWAVDEPRSAELLAQLVAASPPSRRPPPIAQYRELLYPRRTYYERTSPPEMVAVSAPFSPPTPGERSYGSLRSAVESLPGTWTQPVARPGDPEEAVPCLDGRPVVFKLSRARRIPVDAEVATRQPQYVIELGLRAAAIGSPEGRLLVGYGNAPPADAVRAYTIRFGPGPEWAAELHRRQEGLRQAEETRDPSALAGCPRWMAETCPYVRLCGGVTGCGAASTGK